MTTMDKVTIAVCGSAVLCLVVCCGGFMLIFSRAGRQRADSANDARAAIPKKAPAKKSYSVYQAIEPIYCPTSPKFLDSSPLLAPSRFAKVEPGIDLVQVDYGNIGSDEMYWGLSAGGKMRIYVYRYTFESKFKQVRTIEK